MEHIDYRKCAECENYLILNLFRIDSYRCRYCSDNIPLPSRLIRKNKDGEEPIELKVPKSLEEDIISDSFINEL